MLKKYIQLMLIVLIVLTLPACGIDGGGDLKPSATIQSGLNIGNKDDYKHIFKDNDILEISITIDPAYLEKCMLIPMVMSTTLRLLKSIIRKSEYRNQDHG